MQRVKLVNARKVIRAFENGDLLIASDDPTEQKRLDDAIPFFLVPSHDNKHLLVRPDWGGPIPKEHSVYKQDVVLMAAYKRFKRGTREYKPFELTARAYGVKP